MITFMEIFCQACGETVASPLGLRPRSPCEACGRIRGYRVRVVRDDPNARPRHASIQPWFQIAMHGKSPEHTPVDTLNRLMTKHYRNRYGPDAPPPPTLVPERLRIGLEMWPTSQIETLWRGHRRLVPGGETAPDILIDLPIVVVSQGESYCLIDGTTRTNKRLAEGVAEPHPVYLMQPS